MTIDDSKEDVASDPEPWIFRQDLWGAPPPHAIGLVQSADELGQELDTSDGVTWMLYTRDADEAAECLDLVKAARNDEASHGITVLLDIPRERLPGWVDDHEHAIMPVPGAVHGKLTMRTVCVLTAGSSPATLDNRLSTPLVVAQPPPELKTQRANTYVARLTLDRAYCGDSWEKILKSPGKFARTWLGALGVAQLGCGCSRETIPPSWARSCCQRHPPCCFFVMMMIMGSA